MSLAVGLLLALAMLITEVRGRSERIKHGMVSEPHMFFIAKNLVFAGMIAAFSYQLSSYKGLPNVLIVMLLLMLAYDFVTSRTTLGRRIAACFIGGASASGGVGKVLGAVIGAFIMGVMNNGMSIMGIGIDWQQVIKGLVLLAAVCVDVYNKKK